MSMTSVSSSSLPTLSSQGSVDAVVVRVPLAERARIMQQRGVWVVGLWVGLFVLWGAFAPISGGVVAQGLVKVEANRRTVTHRDGGTVARIPVKEGQSVQKGDVLLELEDVRVEASVDMLRAQQLADRLRQSRLEAELAGHKTWQPAPTLLEAFKQEAQLSEQIRKERASFQARQANLSAQLQGDEAQISSTEAEIQARLRERDNAGNAINAMREELELNRQLAKEQFVNRTRVLALERALSDYESRRLSNEAELAQAQQRLGSLRAHAQMLRDNLRQSASDELREVAGRLSDIEQRLRASQDDHARQKVVAPESGRLLNLRVNTPGSALGAREPIVDIVPVDAPLVIEARIPLETGADVVAGVQAEVRINTGYSRSEKLLPAEVIRVSADAVEDQRSGAQFLTAVLHVPSEALKTSGMPMQPGLPVEVYLKISERTPFGFLMEPLTGYFRRSFREH